ncbi:DUF4186 family protein, partial [Mesorhizobium japonicum]|uniref:DUF4186 family protein n=1 Tax=Mesorhizobium japonicum TaxID=2066070 RepID=UPI003B5B4609
MTPPVTPQKREELLEQISAAKIEIAANPSPAGIVPIKIQCKWSACAHGHHTLDHTRRTAAGQIAYPPGHCQSCGEPVVVVAATARGAGLVGGDFGVVVAELRKELIRDHYWTVAIDLKAYNKAYRAGRKKLHEQARRRVIKEMTRNDGGAGRQTPYLGDVIAYAQHAVAACCRRCASYWHGLPADLDVRPSDAELEWMVSAVQAYLDIRLPDLPNEGQKVPFVSRDQEPDDFETAYLDNVLLDQIVHGADP